MSKRKTPKDELLLAEMIAAAKSKGLKWTRSYLFRDKNSRPCAPDRAAACCANGALILCGNAEFTGNYEYASSGRINTGAVLSGNDGVGIWMRWSYDDGESLGWAFRNAMDGAV